MVTHFEEAPGPGGEMQIQWTEHYKPPLGGRTALICFAALLDEICHAGPLSVEDQQSLILLGEMLSGIDPTKSAKRLSKWTAA